MEVNVKKRMFDVTGVIQDGMWNYEPPFPKISIKPMPPIPWAGGDVYCEIFEGMHSQTGTYLETPAHYYGNNDPRTMLLIDVPIQKMVDAPCVLLNLSPLQISANGKRHAITADQLKTCRGSDEIKAGDAILVGSGWGRFWMAPEYLNGGPYFTKDAMDWILSKKPSMLGGDSPRWENLEEPQGIFPDFYAADVLMVGPLVNLENIPFTRCRLTALPLKVAQTSCSPARVILTEM